MIVEVAIGVVLDILTAVLGWIPTFTLPDAVRPASLVGLVEPFAAALGVADPYVDVTLLVVGIGAILSAFAVALIARGLRIVLSLVSGGGGSAA